MEILKFLDLNEEAQWEEFSEQGVYLAEFMDIDVRQNLSRLYDFYVEISSDKILGLH